MIRFPTNGILDAEDSSRFGDDDIPQEIVAMDAARQIRSGFYTLASCAHEGNREALEDLLNLSRDMIHFLGQGLDEVDPSDEGSKEYVRDFLRELAGKSTSWPVNLPVESTEQSNAIKEFNERPYGKSLDYIIRKPGSRGNPPAEYTKVTLCVVRCFRKIQAEIKNGERTVPNKGRIPWRRGTVPAMILEGLLRRRFGSRVMTLEELSGIYWDVPPATLSKILSLPDLTHSHQSQWADVATEFLSYPKPQKTFLPESWQDKVLTSSKTFNSFTKDRIKNGLTALYFPRGK